ncbi:MAG: hypothetical protein ICV85_09610 [Tolypothrix sp. T3-bin4]|nr:hypothetical protein [Tolypothrix sp. T3-bin4]
MNNLIANLIHVCLHLLPDSVVKKVNTLSRHADIKTLMTYDNNRHRHQADVTGLLAEPI